MNEIFLLVAPPRYGVSKKFVDAGNSGCVPHVQELTEVCQFMDLSNAPFVLGLTLVAA